MLAAVSLPFVKQNIHSVFPDDFQCVDSANTKTFH